MRAAAYLAPLAGLAALAAATPGVAGCSTGCASCCLPSTHTIQVPGVNVAAPSVSVGGVGYGGGYGGAMTGGGVGGEGGSGGSGGSGGNGGNGGSGGSGGAGGSGLGGSGYGGSGAGGEGGAGSGQGGSGGAGSASATGGAANVATSQGVGIAVQVINNAAASSTTAANASGTTTANSATVANLLASGGGSSFYVDQGPSSTIGVLNVDQPNAPVDTGPVCLQYAPAVQVVAVQATCLDDKDVPHPASQVMPGREVAPGYSGEVFRCIAGARMQYVLGSFAGQPDFARGQTVVCNKGDALWRGGDGRMQCRPQTPARDCNERSLLRRYGAGIKLVQVSGGGQCVRFGGGQSVASAQGQGPVTGLLIDGGVGGVAH